VRLLLYRTCPSVLSRTATTLTYCPSGTSAPNKSLYVAFATVCLNASAHARGLQSIVATDEASDSAVASAIDASINAEDSSANAGAYASTTPAGTTPAAATGTGTPATGTGAPVLVPSPTSTCVASVTQPCHTLLMSVSCLTVPQRTLRWDAMWAQLAPCSRRSSRLLSWDPLFSDFAGLEA
jgi:hypothetical protein